MASTAAEENETLYQMAFCISTNKLFFEWNIYHSLVTAPKKTQAKSCVNSSWTRQLCAIATAIQNLHNGQKTDFTCSQWNLASTQVLSNRKRMATEFDKAAEQLHYRFNAPYGIHTIGLYLWQREQTLPLNCIVWIMLFRPIAIDKKYHFSFRRNLFPKCLTNVISSLFISILLFFHLLQIDSSWIASRNTLMEFTTHTTWCRAFCAHQHQYKYNCGEGEKESERNLHDSSCSKYTADIWQIRMKKIRLANLTVAIR